MIITSLKGKYFLFVLIAMMLAHPIFAQSDSQSSIDSIFAKWQTIKNDSNASKKVRLLLDISDELNPSNPDSAIVLNKMALKIAKNNNLFRLAGEALSGMGYARYIKGEYDFAMEKFMRALKIYDSIDFQRGRAAGLNTIGMIKNMQEHYDESIESHLKSLEIAKKINDTALIATNHFNIGISLHASGRNDSALLRTKKALSYKDNFHNKENVYQIYNIIGRIYSEKQNFIKASENYMKVINAPNFDNKWELAFAYAGMSKVFQKQGKLDKSVEYGLRSYKLAKEVGARWDKQNITKILSETYAEQKNWKEAYKYHKLHKTYSDSIFNEKRDNKINYLRLKRKESENKALEKENRLKEVQITKRNHQLIGGAIGILALMVVVFLLFRNNYLKNQLNKNLKRKNEEIASKNKELKELNTTKDTMLRVIAHDLKNPVSVMVSYTEVIVEDYDEYKKDELLETIKKLNKSSNEGLRLLENLTEWARAQTGAISFEPEQIKLREIVEENINLFISNAEEKGITLKSDVEPSATAYADYNMTSTILRNLIANAIKFTPDSGQITIESSKKENMEKISVNDTGVGLNTEALNKLFKLNDSYKSRGTRNEKGSGLGLLICKEFVEKQGGEIWVESQEDKGSTFSFTLPISDDKTT